MEIIIVITIQTSLDSYNTIFICIVSNFISFLFLTTNGKILAQNSNTYVGFTAGPPHRNIFKDDVPLLLEDGSAPIIPISFSLHEQHSINTVTIFVTYDMVTS